MFLDMGFELTTGESREDPLLGDPFQVESEQKLQMFGEGFPCGSIGE